MNDDLSTEMNRRVKQALAEVAGPNTRVWSDGPVIWINGDADKLDMEMAWRALETARVGLLEPACLACQNYADDRSCRTGETISPRDFCLTTRPFTRDCGGDRP